MTRSDDAASRRWLRLYRPVWWSVAAPVGILGIAGVWLEIGVGAALVLLVALAMLGAFGVWQFGPLHRDGPPALSDIVFGTTCSLGFLAVLGLGYELGAAGLLGGAVVAAAGWPLRRRRGAGARANPTPSGPAPPRGPALEMVPPTALPAPSGLCALSTQQLCFTWRASYVCLSRYPWPSYLDHLAELRRACLDELERRDPTAFARWLPTARAAGDPSRYFCGQSRQ